MPQSKCGALPLGDIPMYGVNDGTRTHDNQCHKLALYQLNYIHHMEDLRKTTRRVSKRDRGCFWYARRDSNPRPTA